MFDIMFRIPRLLRFQGRLPLHFWLVDQGNEFAYPPRLDSRMETARALPL